MKLEKGDKIGIIAPAGVVLEPEKLKSTLQLFADFGYKTKVYDSCYNSFRAMAGCDSKRLEDLHAAFSDNEIKAIICARGGYGALRLVDNIDYELISRNPKIFAGSSDITVLLLNIYKQAHLEVFHSPMALNGFDKETFGGFLNTVNGITREIAPHKDFKTLTQGDAQGILWGGNLATVVSLFGSNPETYIPEDNIILFLEDLNEANYKIDRMLRQIFRNNELKKRIAGLVFGDFLECGDKNELLEILCEYAKLFNVPCAKGYPITHLKANIALPVGRLVNFNSKSGKIYYL